MAYAIHRDFKHLPRIPVSYNPAVLATFNALQSFERWLKRHKGLAGSHSESIKFPASDGGVVKTTLISPSASNKQQLPLLLYYHGGAFVFTHTSHHLRNCEAFALEANCRVLFVDYRLSPQNRFPAGLNDCFDSLKWAIKNAEKIGIDQGNIVVGGDSAGGALAATVAQRALDQGIALKGQLLIYPVIDAECSSDSATQFIDTPIWQANSNRGMWKAYLGGQRHAPRPQYAAAADRKDLSDLCPAYVETAEFDPLRDEAKRYAERLIADGVATERNDTLGTVHGYDMVKHSEISQGAKARRIQFLQQCFA